MRECPRGLTGRYTSINIVPASKANLEAVVSWIRNKDECRIWAGSAVSFPIEKSLLAGQIAFDSDNAYACVDHNGLLAFGQIFKIPNGYSHMARIITNPRYRGQGFGRSICRSLVGCASELDTSGVSLNVYRNNAPALSLYKSLGFQERCEKSDESNVYMVRV